MVIEELFYFYPSRDLSAFKKDRPITSRLEDICGEQNYQMRGNNPIYIKQYLSQITLQQLIFLAIWNTIRLWQMFSSFQYSLHYYVCLEILYLNVKRQNSALHHYSEQYHRKCRAKEIGRYLNWHTDYAKWICGYMDVNWNGNDPLVVVVLFSSEYF